MEKVDWINWSSIARHAFAETLEDVKELELIKKVNEISEMHDSLNLEVKASVANEAVRLGEKISKELKSGKRKALTVEEFSKW